MKRIISTIFVTVLFLSSCQQKPVEVQPVDTEAVKNQIKEVMDKWESTLRGKDLIQMSSLFSEDLLYLGTDPSEFWGKEAMVGIWKQTFADSSFSIAITIDKQEIKLASDGNSAIAIQQFYAAEMSPKIPIRFVYHLIKAKGGWLIDFVSVAFIPKNEDIAILNSALNQ